MSNTSSIHPRTEVITSIQPRRRLAPAEKNAVCKVDFLAPHFRQVDKADVIHGIHTIYSNTESLTIDESGQPAIKLKWIRTYNEHEPRMEMSVLITTTTSHRSIKSVHFERYTYIYSRINKGTLTNPEINPEVSKKPEGIVTCNFN